MMWVTLAEHCTTTLAGNMTRLVFYLVCVLLISIIYSGAPRKILLCRVFFPHDLDSAADALLAGVNPS